MLSFTDHLGRTIKLPAYPERIISLVPSQTELLFDLDLQEKVVGITKFCIHPQQWFRSKTRVGGTKTLKLDIIDSLRPDLILANKEENTREQIDTLAEKYPVWISDVNDLETALTMIVSVGEITNRKEKAFLLSKNIQNIFTQFSTQLQQETHKPRTAYLIWKNPYMTAGGDTFIHSMLAECGLENIFKNLARYPQINVQDIAEANCEVLLLSSEPFPFRQSHIEELRHQLPQTKILLVDGEMFSWYGSRLTKAVEYFQSLRFKV